ncbi:MAG: hypothetical protein ACI93R_000921 [Flavobacteriales bacterium]|jgi:hypothetical protein
MKPYLAHLVSVDEIQPVRLTRDICTKTNDVLLEKGSRFTRESGVLCSQNELAENYDDAFVIEGGFSSEVILDVLKQSIQEDIHSQKLYSSIPIFEQLKACVDYFCEFPTLVQRLTALAIQLPVVFDQALWVAWVSASSLQPKGVPQDKLNVAFLSALSHDFGMLDIDPDIVFKTERYSAQDIEKVQKHPIHSAQLLEAIPNIPSDCIRAVKEHHERSDGTGYPERRFHKQISQGSQLLSALDTANALYIKHFKDRNRSPHDMLALLQVSCLASKDPIFELISTCFKTTSLTYKHELNATLIPATVIEIKENAAKITHFIKCASTFMGRVGFKHGEIRVLGLLDIFRSIALALDRVRIINPAYLRWLDQVVTGRIEESYREVEDVLLICKELQFHQLRFVRELEAYLALNEGGSIEASRTLHEDLLMTKSTP